jgi:hypothetical protein
MKIRWFIWVALGFSITALLDQSPKRQFQATGPSPQIELLGADDAPSSSILQVPSNPASQAESDETPDLNEILGGS